MEKKRPRTEGPERRQVVVDRLAGKLSKEEANYHVVEAENPSTKEVCFECDHYLNPGEPISACVRVAGPVKAEATCDYFVARPHEGLEQERRK